MRRMLEQRLIEWRDCFRYAAHVLDLALDLAWKLFVLLVVHNWELILALLMVAGLMVL